MILVTGAAGLNGSRLVAKLASQNLPVRALVRRPMPPMPGVEFVEGDLLRPETLDAALHGVTRAMLISSSAPDMVEAQNTFITAAKNAGVKHIVKLSGIIADPASPFRFARMHAAIEVHLAASGVAYTNLRAGEFMHAYFRQLPNIKNKRILALPMEDARIASIDVDDLVDVAAHILTSDRHADKTYHLTGPEASTMTEVAAHLSNVIGEPIRYIDVAPEDARRAHLAAGIPPFNADALMELFAARRRGQEATVYADFAALVGRAPIGFAAFAQRHAATFR